MNRRPRFARWAAAVAAVAAVWLPGGPGAAAPPAAAADCTAPPALAAIDGGFARTARRIEAGEAVTIIALGSSSTQGVGASSPAASYPSRLERELKARFPTVAIRVVNLGRGGQDVGEELARLGREAIRENPDLVIWQLGTNAVLRHDDLAADGRLIDRGVAAMREDGIDVVLMDLQYAPRVLARRGWGEMERLIAAAARRSGVGFFRRFDIMHEWDRTQQLAPAALIGADGLHMTDASYRCLASLLAGSLAEHWTAPDKLARSSHRSPATVAGGTPPAAGATR